MTSLLIRIICQSTVCSSNPLRLLHQKIRGRSLLPIQRVKTHARLNVLAMHSRPCSRPSHPVYSTHVISTLPEGDSHVLSCVFHLFLTDKPSGVISERRFPNESFNQGGIGLQEADDSSFNDGMVHEPSRITWPKYCRSTSSSLGTDRYVFGGIRYSSKLCLWGCGCAQWVCWWSPVRCDPSPHPYRVRFSIKRSPHVSEQTATL